jgi:hypothetical protein
VLRSTEFNKSRILYHFTDLIESKLPPPPFVEFFF